MVRTQRSRLGNVVGLALTASLLGATTGHALYVDEEQNVNLRAQIYSQGSIRIKDSSLGTHPVAQAGQLVQNRNFFSPELDAKLTEYTGFLRGGALDWLAPDDLRFRVAGWMFYDGIYDYGARQFNQTQRGINSNLGQLTGVCSAGSPRAGQPCSADSECLPGQCKPANGGWFISGQKLGIPSPAMKNEPVFLSSFEQAYPDFDAKEPRSTYAHQERVNELYLSYSKGPVFVRLGRQSLSWGEADTIALLDQMNPFDITVAAPGIFEDIDEARIPLWMIRASYNLFETLGPLSSGFVEAYWVPGNIDTNTGISPILTASPYSPRGQNPQLNGGPPFFLFPINYQFVFFDHLPRQRFDNSRYGFRFQTVINRLVTAQAWFYTTFPQAPVPRKAPWFIIPYGDAPGQERPFFPVELVHDLTYVPGAAATFFFEPLDTIVRAEGELFIDEASFVPQKNLNIQNPQGRSNVFGEGVVPHPNIFRWETGFDRFFFFRPLNPTNSFIFVLSGVGAWNPQEGTGVRDFRMNGQLKPGPKPTGPFSYTNTGSRVDNFVQAKAVEFFTQMTLQTDYMHGRLSPRFTYIQNKRGTYALLPSVTYRWSDWLLFQLSIVHIGGEYQSFGFFRDRDQVALRATYQLN